MSEPRLPRRAFLAGTTGGLGLLALVGCQPERDRRPSTPDPLEPLLAAAIFLADRYTAAMAAIPDLAGQLTPLREIHRTHLVELTKELGTVDSGALPSGQPPVAPPPTSAGAVPSGSVRSTTPSGSVRSTTPSGGQSPAAPASPAPLPSDRAGILTDLRTLERTGQAQATAACLAAPGYRAALLGSIAAARASNAEVLTS